LKAGVVFLSITGLIVQSSTFKNTRNGCDDKRIHIAGDSNIQVHRFNDIIYHDLPDEDEANKSVSTKTPNSASNRRFSQELLKTSRASHQQWFIYKMADHGLGAVLMNLFYKMLFMEDVYARQVIVDETVGKYRRNQTMGVLTGYFTPQMPVIDTKRQFAIINPILSTDNGITLNKFPSMRYNYMHPSNLNNDTFIFLTGHTEYRKEFWHYYKPILQSTELYRKLLQQACPHIQFNAQTRQEIEAIKDRHGLPNYADTERSNSVAFHIRRGDKIYTESRAFAPEEYVKRFLSISPAIGETHFHYCYIATDDEAVVADTTAVLKQYNVSCAIQSMANDSLQQKRHGPAATIHFLAELSVLKDATIFVGSMNSNVGMLVSMLRGCHQLQREGLPRPHFGASYGVAETRWQMF
jgi:hypothetical protein